MLLFQQGPAETTIYMIAGYMVIFGMIFFYIVSLVARSRSLEKDLTVLKELDENVGLE